MKFLVLLGFFILTLSGWVPQTEAALPRFPDNIVNKLDITEDQLKVDSDRIVGGQVAVNACQFPYQVSLQRKLSSGSSHFCGASLISPTVALCAGHCAAGQTPGHIVAVVGTNTLAGGGTKHTIKAIRLHENYNAHTIDNDISLFYFDEPVELNNDTVALVSLPTEDTELPAGTDCIVSGWGTIKEGDSSISTLLRYVEVPIISRDECNAKYGDGEITENMICAGIENGGRDSCQGDSGGPLVDEKTKTQFGIVSWGYGCARPEYPGVYTNIVKYLQWIKQYVDVVPPPKRA